MWNRKIANNNEPLKLDHGKNAGGMIRFLAIVQTEFEFHVLLIPGDSP